MPVQAMIQIATHSIGVQVHCGSGLDYGNENQSQMVNLNPGSSSALGVPLVGGIMKRHVSLCCLVVLGFAANFFAQGVGASGDVKGMVTDSSGAIMQHVAVAIVDAGRGIRHTAATDS